MGHIVGAIAVDFVPPIQARTDGVVVIRISKILSVVEYPYAYMAIGNTRCAGKDGPLGQLPHIAGLEFASIRLPAYWRLWCMKPGFDLPP